MIRLYEPSNGTELDSFSSNYCFKCSKMAVSSDAKNQCQVLGRMLAFSKEDREYPKQMRYVDGSPTCTAFVSREEANKKRNEKRRIKPKSKKDNLTLSLF